MKKAATTIMILLCISLGIRAQVGISTDGSTPNSSAMLDLNSNNRGLLIPRMTTTARNLIPSPSPGLLVYDTTANLFCYFNGSFWYQAEAALLTSTIGTSSPAGIFAINSSSAVGPNNSTVLDISNPTRGVLIPRTTTGSIANPATGLIIYNTATSRLCYYNGTEWATLCSVSTGNPGATGSQASIGVAISANNSSPHSSAMLDVSATNKGLLIPRLTNAQRDLLKPLKGLVIYNTTSNNIEFFNGTAWCRMVTTPNCFSCGSTVTANHVAGLVAPESNLISYSTVSGIQGETSKCWTTSNLGADHQAFSVNDASEGSAGWYWQFNRKQGYMHDGINRTPNTTWINPISETVDWLAANDPCTSELGSGWRIPTWTEWQNVWAYGNWTDWNGSWYSGLKLHAAGKLLNTSGFVSQRGSNGYYWSGTGITATNAWSYNISGSTSGMFNQERAYAFPLRCIRDGSANPVLPAVTTTSVFNLATTSLTVGGMVSDDGGSSVTTRGFCWGTASGPTVSGNHTNEGSGTGIFMQNLNNLLPVTTYFIRAYATNVAGNAYGNELTVTTPGVAPGFSVVTTSLVTGITQTTAVCGGNVVSDGASVVTARGVCWSLTVDPVISGYHTTNGTGTGTFTSSITSLMPNRTYFVRAYATNGFGTAYGDNKILITPDVVCGSSFTTLHTAGTTAPVSKTVTYGTVKNIPGEISKCWITGNLGADHQATVVSDATEASAGWYWQFNRRQGYKHDGTTRTPNTAWITPIDEMFDWQGSNDPCALEIGQGWRLPTSTEYNNINGTGNWTNWTGPWNSALKLHAAGYLSSDLGSLLGPGTSGCYWSGSQDNSAVGYHLFFSNLSSGMGNNLKYFGMPVRCLREDRPSVLFVPGSYQGWNPTDSATIIKPKGAAGNYEGYIWFSENNTAFKYTQGPSWNTNWGDNGGNGTLEPDGANIIAGTAGYYKLNVNLNTLTHTFLRTTWSVVGNSTAGGWNTDTDMTWDPVNKVWTVTLNLTSGGIKFRANHAATLVYGDDLNDGSLDENGGTIWVWTAGNYTITLDLKIYSYTITYHCGTSLTVFHPAGTVAPVAKTVTYGLATNIPGEPTKCWITSNLGADHTATAVDDATEASAGWYWQFNRKQGYKHDGTNRTPNSAWISSISENCDWQWSNDPCAALLGTGWRIPTLSEWNNVRYNGSWSNWNGAYASALKLHGAGLLMSNNGQLGNRGARGYYWSSNADNNTNGKLLEIYNISYSYGYVLKTYGASVRCIRGDISNAVTPAPTITTNSAMNISESSANTGGYIYASGSAIVTERGICWGPVATPSLSGNHTSDGSGAGYFGSILDNLTANTLYYMRAYAITTAGTIYGNEVIFTTLPEMLTINTTEVTNITLVSATFYSNIVNEGGSPVIARGVCWGTSPNPLVTGLHSTDGTGKGTFFSYLTGLSPTTTYFARAYATNGNGTGYGNEIKFKTGQLVTAPVVTTSQVTNITAGSATGNGIYISNGGAFVTEGGLCWSTSPNPTTADSHTTGWDPLMGFFPGNITGLTANTLYYVRSYAINSAGTGYGNQVVFSTLSNPVAPTVTTSPYMTNITRYSATGSGTITSGGGVPVTARGLCWSTSPNPTLAGSHTSNGTGIGQFTGDLAGLSPGTQYHIRAYATNSVGTTYGNDIVFTTTTHYIGEAYAGGIIYYINGTDGVHGKVASTSDLSLVGDQWPSTNNSCNLLVRDGYDDWYLPNSSEMALVCQNKGVIGSFSGTYYWTSTFYIEWDKYYFVHLTNCNSDFAWLNNNFFARPVRQF